MGGLAGCAVAQTEGGAADDDAATADGDLVDAGADSGVDRAEEVGAIDSSREVGADVSPGDVGSDGTVLDVGRADAGNPDASPSDAGPYDSGRTDAGFDARIDSGVDVGVDVPIDVGVDVPRVCTGPASQACGTCGTQTRTCVSGTWSAWSGCTEPSLPLAGNWRIALSPLGGGSTVPSLTWFTASVSTGALSGGAVDRYGYAELTGVSVNPCTRQVAYTKHYLVGTSTGSSFRYVGAWLAGPPATYSGSWTDLADSTNTSSYSAVARSGRTASTFAGSWRLTVDFGTVTSCSFTVGATGGLTGTMVDTYGSATLQGTVDLGSGALMFAKHYSSGSSMGQEYVYSGTLNTAGTAITGGTWEAQGTTVLTGTWSAVR